MAWAPIFRYKEGVGEVGQASSWGVAARVMASTTGASMAVATAWMRALVKLLALMRICTGGPVNEGGTDGIRAVYHVVPEQGVPIQEPVEVDGHWGHRSCLRVMQIDEKEEEEEESLNWLVAIPGITETRIGPRDGDGRHHWRGGGR